MSAAVPVTEMHSGDLDRIRNLIPFRHLDDQQFKQIVLDASFNNLDSGQTLFDQQLVDNVIFYLLDGQLDISDQHDQTFCVTGGSIETLHPITMHCLLYTSPSPRDPE